MMKERSTPITVMKKILSSITLAVGMLTSEMIPCASAGTFQEVGTHPQASLQKTAEARKIRSLEAWNGELYAAYGDSLVNYGPIWISPFDPETKTFAQGWPMLSQIIPLYRTVSGQLVAINGDSMGSGSFAISSATEGWEHRMAGGQTHVSDVATFNGKDLWSEGGFDGMTRTLEGCKWSVVEYQQMMCLYQGKMYCGSVVYDAVTRKNKSIGRVFDGTTWTTGPSLFPDLRPGWNPSVFAGKMVYQDGSAFYNGGNRPNLRVFNGTSVSFIDNVLDYKIAGSKLYTLGTNGVIRSTGDLSSWNTITTAAPSTSRSIALVNGKIYIGTTNSKILEYSDPVSTLPEVVINAIQPYAFEGGANGSMMISRFGSTANSLTVRYTVSGPATSGTDYTALSGVATIPAGQSSITIPISIINDTELELNEWLLVALSPSSAYETANPNSIRIDVFDNDRPTVSVVATDSTASESGDAGKLTITRTGKTDLALAVNISAGGAPQAKNGYDYEKIPRQVTIPAGSQSVTLTVKPINDTVVERAEQVRMNIIPSSAYNVGTIESVMIQDND
jgi:hypothetical protein